jgi:hypothetical protein
MPGRFHLWLALLAVFAAMTCRAQMGGGAWMANPVQFKLQWPTNAAQNERYWNSNGIYHFKVFSNDGAFTPGNRTKPRTEQRFPDYTHGEVQYQSMEMAPSNENSYCIFQIHTGNAQSHQYGATAFMLFWFSNDGGSVYDYSNRQLASHLGNKWFQLNVDHDVDHNLIKVWINKKLVWTQKTRGAKDFYFKDGVYVQKHDPTYQMDSYITDIRIWTKSDTVTPRLASRQQPPIAPR